MRLAMWSGPRNLSTAMMYAFAQRPDFTVVDEPFYATYLAATGLDHPMRAEILTSQPQDPADVIAGLLGACPRAHVYHKHMVQHMIAGVPTDWCDQCRHVFLIRHPARVVASFAAKYEHPTADDLGFARQTELFEEMQARGLAPLVVDAADVRQDPEAMLRSLCTALGLEFDPNMLSWPQGGNASDGVWASHWYGAVHRSTGFAGAEGGLPTLTGALADLAEAALPDYLALHAQRLAP